MGAVDFSLSPNLVAMLKDALPLQVFVETGTFEGASLANVVDRFDEIHSVELSPEHLRKAQERFAGHSNVHLELGDSPVFLGKLAPRLAQRSVLYFLDAHWCVASDTAGQESQCPLLAEIAAIGSLGESSVVLIDDARLFLAPPPEPHEVSHWPSLDQIVMALRALSSRHELMVLNDVILFYPASIGKAVNAHARRHGIDWLRATQSLQENAALRNSLEGKEGVIREQSLALKAILGHETELVEIVKEKELVIESLKYSAAHPEPEPASRGPAVTMKVLEEKEAVIKELSTALASYRATFAVLGAFIVPLNHLVLGVRSVIRRSTKFFTPRLGVLNQHEPKDLVLPAHYSNTPLAAAAPRISIVTPSFKQAHFIERTIVSVLEQGYPDLEYVVQDGASGDGTREILERYSARIASWESRRDNGQTEAINRGFERTSGEIMAWLNSDDLLLPGTLAYVANFFNANPDVDVVYGHRVLIDEEDRQIGRWMLPEHSNEVLSWADYVPQETLFWRRRIWEKAGGRVDESFRFAMDWDLLIRFREAGARFARLPRFLGGFRIHPQQKTSASIGDVGFDEMDRIRERVLGRVPSKMEVRKAVLPYLMKHVATDVAWQVRQRFGFPS